MKTQHSLKKKTFFKAYCNLVLTSLSFLLFHYFLFCTSNIKVLPVSYPWRGEWQPTPVVLPGKSHGWRSLAGPSPWGHKESDTTEWLTVSYPMALFMLSPLPGMLSPPTHAPRPIHSYKFPLIISDSAQCESSRRAPSQLVMYSVLSAPCT